MNNNSLYGLIGYPLSHSFSKNYFSKKFEQLGIANTKYELFELKSIEGLTELLQQYNKLCGLNVTIPYKESVIPFLNELDVEAQAVGAVNCIKITKVDNNHFLKGYNTDIYGFKQSIKPFLESQHERALILGTGGSSKAVYHVLKQIGIDCFFVSRSGNIEKTKNTFNYEQINEYVINSFKLIVNTTPVGMYPQTNAFPPIPYMYISNTHLLYDLVYNPPETEFLKRGKQQGAVTVNGLSMLQLQAEESWRIWTKNGAGTP